MKNEFDRIKNKLYLKAERKFEIGMAVNKGEARALMQERDAFLDGVDAVISEISALEKDGECEEIIPLQQIGEDETA